MFNFRLESVNVNLPRIWVSLVVLAVIQICTAELSLPLPSLILEIKPTVSIYSPTGNPKCFRIAGGESPTSRDIVAMSNGYGAFDTARVVFLVHGFKDNENSLWLHELKNAIMKERPQTVVIVGWGRGADDSTIEYKKALANIKTTSIWLGEIITNLRIMKPNIYIWGIGHSLGAHLLGQAGRSSPRSFNRITALDPAAPLLDRNLDLRLKSSDAVFVDVIHSDGCTSEMTTECWVVPNNHYGTLAPLGTIDFYPRYGLVNPVANPLDVYRSHRRAVDLFLISITHQGLFATNEILDGTPGFGQIIVTRQVSEIAEMGYWADTAFIPEDHQDHRVNFYINNEKMTRADRLSDSRQKVGMKHRRRRDLSQPIDCVALPSNANIDRFSQDALRLGIFLTFTWVLLL